MQLIEWNNNYNLGIIAIDEHHQKLVRLLNNSYDALLFDNMQDAGITFNRFIDFTNFHFSTEENIMSKYNYLSKDKHEIVHYTLRKKIRELLSELNTTDLLNSLRLVSFLKDWLLNDILITDKELAGFLINDGVS